MKKNKLLLGLIPLLAFCHDINAQSTQTGLFAAGHSPGVGGVPIRYCGWDASVASNAIPFSLEHRGTNNINFRLGGTQYMTIRGTASGTPGFVGIGIAVPTQKLTVSAGNINIDLGGNGYMILNQFVVRRNVSSIFLGVGAGPLGPQCAFTGFNAGTVNSGNNNTFNGFNSGVANTLGDANVFMGAFSATGNLNGAGNVFIGAFCATTNSSGSGNTVLGFNANVGSGGLNNASSFGTTAVVMNSNQMILGNNSVNVGIGLSGNATGPQNKLEINTAVANTSGLRFTQLNSGSPPVANVGNMGLLALNATGDIIYVNGLSATSFGTCALPVSLGADANIDLNGSNFYFTRQGLTKNMVGIGVPCTSALAAKLDVLQTSGNVGSIGVQTTNSDNDAIALKAVANGSSSVPFNNVAGWFESTGLTGPSGPQAVAIFVPTGKGKVDIGFATPTTFNTGLLNVNGSVFSTSYNIIPSSTSVKHNIHTLGTSIDLLKRLRPVTFEWNTVVDTLMGGIRTGFVAEEVDTIISQVVHTVGSLKGISYTELIPYIVKGMQEQQARIEHQDSVIHELVSTVNGCCASSIIARTDNNGFGGATKNIQEIKLSLPLSISVSEARPNPNNGKAEIDYYVPSNISNAKIIFSDMMGRIISEVILVKGYGTISVNTQELPNGMYSYTLQVDGKVIDTKKMLKQE